MRDDFHLVDLRSQAASVQSLLRGRSGAEKLEWFSLHGSITPRPKEMPDERQSYWFESRMGAACCSSGRKVYFEQLHIRSSTLGFLEGRAEAIRTEVIRRLPDEIARTYGCTGLLLREPAAGPLPSYTFFVELHSHSPVKPGADCSSLVVVWFSDSLPESLSSELMKELEGIEWERYAKDGYYQVGQRRPESGSLGLNRWTTSHTTRLCQTIFLSAKKKMQHQSPSRRFEGDSFLRDFPAVS